MRRRVLYRGRAAEGAASLLADDFEVRELDGASSPAEPSGLVVLVDAGTGRVSLDAETRVIALVEPGAPGPWPDDWYALLPVDVTRAVLARAVQNAFADLDTVTRASRLARELSELNAIGIRLSAERDSAALMETILLTARRMTSSDAGSLYVVEEDAKGGRRLRFALAQNDSVAVPFQTVTLPLSADSVAGHAALTGEVVNLADAYAPPPGAPFHINRSFDQRTGYRTKSMLVVPMRTPPGETIGVLQLINCKRDSAVRLASPRDVDAVVVPYTAHHERLAGSLASQAAVALDNGRLYDNIRRLFEGFVRAAVIAIESRDPSTFGHSFRVAELSQALAELVNACDVGPYAATRLTREELTELRYAALLHDFGKVGVREQLLLKATKLEPGGLERIRQRVELITRGLELRTTREKLRCLLKEGQRGYESTAEALDRELAEAIAELDAGFAQVVAANEPTVLPEDAAAVIERLAARPYADHLGNLHTLITADEAHMLATPRGSLTAEEYREIQAHVLHTFRFLSQIPWTREFRRIPEIAAAHHERLDGSGYPRGLTAPDIPVQARIMTIVDIFDALTARDRPYKRALPVREALEILEEERRSGLLDGELLDLFVAGRVYDRVVAG